MENKHNVGDEQSPIGTLCFVGKSVSCICMNAEAAKVHCPPTQGKKAHKYFNSRESTYDKMLSFKGVHYTRCLYARRQCMGPAKYRSRLLTTFKGYLAHPASFCVSFLTFAEKTFVASLKAWSARCAYRCVVAELECPKSFPTIFRLRPLETK